MSTLYKVTQFVAKYKWRGYSTERVLIITPYYWLAWIFFKLFRKTYIEYMDDVPFDKVDNQE